MSQPFSRRLAGAFIVVAVLAASAAAQTGGNTTSQGWRKTSEPYFLGAGDRKWLQDFGVVEGHCNRQAVAGVVSAGPSAPEQPRSEVATLRGDVPMPPPGRALAAPDRACMGHALELAPEGRAVYWADAGAGYTYRVTALRTYQALGWPCREFVLEVTRGKRAPEYVRGRACRTEDGVWGIAG